MAIESQWGHTEDGVLSLSKSLASSLIWISLFSLSVSLVQIGVCVLFCARKADYGVYLPKLNLIIGVPLTPLISF